MLKEKSEMWQITNKKSQKRKETLKLLKYLRSVLKNYKKKENFD